MQVFGKLFDKVTCGTETDRRCNLRHVLGSGDLQLFRFPDADLIQVITEIHMQKPVETSGKIAVAQITEFCHVRCTDRFFIVGDHVGQGWGELLF